MATCFMLYLRMGRDNIFDFFLLIDFSIICLAVCLFISLYYILFDMFVY